MATKIYTKTGDLGKTSLLGGTKVSKNHLRIESYGTVDELNAFIGMANDYITDAHATAMLKEIQEQLFIIGSSLACDSENTAMKIPALKEEDVLLLEKEIDAMTAKLPVMKNFILPGGHLAVSALHVARCVCRRAERNCVNMKENNLYIEDIIIKYLNRLSDYLFVLARYVGHLLHVPEILWQPRA